ncbi:MULTISPECIES: hypothetical protein [Cryobacterium]|uniref:hypothetical protein n=1 Tax=Cryobacterium TaxID=69578 RepID=UPI000CD3F94A|nr:MULTISPECIES: hypothetical protein [Cryobacterium]POH67776.1 hypothetical protein C3B60_06015 [Cryobacterium zongtaii]TFC47776.1 hypothetical protein E3O57_02210 [Cryobacterium sp. TMN-39-2]
MSQNSSRPLSKFNLVLALLWLVDVVVTAAGYLILTSSNATQAEFYTSQSSDYVAYFSAQSGSGLGATLIGTGILGFIITLAAMVVSRSIAKNAVVAPAAIDEEPDFDFDETDFDSASDTDEKTAVTTPAAAAPTVVAPTADTTSGDEPTDEPKTDR